MAFTLGKRRLFVATDVQCEDMLDAAAVADAVSQEVRFFVNGVQLDDPAITTPEGKIAQMQAVAYLPTSDEIAALAEPLFWASLLPEEGRATSFRVLVRNPDDMTDRFVPLI